MENTTATKSRKLSDIISTCFNSVWFIWFLAAITFVFWVFKQELAGLTVLIVLLTAILFTCRDATPAMSCAAFAFFVFSDTAISFAGREMWFLALAPVLAGFIFNIVKYRTDNFPLRGFSFAFLVTLLPWLLQGIARADREILPALIAMGIGVLFCLVYFGFNICVRRKEGLNEYMAHFLLALGALISAQIIYYYLSRGDYRFTDNYIRLGWGTRNPVAAILSLTLPAPFYFAVKKGKLSFLWLLLAYLELTLILILRSRGVTVISMAAFLVLLIYAVVCSKGKKKIPVLIMEGLFVIAVILAAIFKLDVIKALFQRFADSGFDGLGRDTLYDAGIGVFCDNFVFGAGFDYKLPIFYQIVSHSDGPVYYHSTVIQILACFGILGAAAYIYLYFWRYRIALTDIDAVKTVLLIGMLTVESYSFIDTIIFQPMCYFIFMCISLCMEKSLRDDQVTPLVLRRASKKYQEGK